MFLPLPVCREHVLRTATVALDVAQTLIDDLGSDVQRLQLFDAFACLFKTLQPGGTDQARLLRRIVVAGRHPNDSLLPELELIIGCIMALSRMLWQLKDSDVDASPSLLNTMLAFAHRHARQRNALALLESGMQLLFFTYRRDNNAAIRPVCCCPTRCSGARSSCR